MDGYIQCPEVFRADDARRMDRTLFLGGGITGCGDWQAEFAAKLAGSGVVILNPRRAGFDPSDPSMTEFQIQWEFHHLRMARARLFWFPPETLCPITLFELGKFCERADPLFVGVHPEYKRRIDVETQLRFARPLDHAVHPDLDSLAAAVRAWAATL
jgi:hypothetical protein